MCIRDRPDIDDKEVWDINREKAFLAPERIRLVTGYILTHFDQKTYREMCIRDSNERISGSRDLSYIIPAN